MAPKGDGTLERRNDGLDVIRFERRLAHPVERVWAALTDPAQLRGWWGEARIDAAEGGVFALRWLNTDEEGNAFAMDARVAALERPWVLELASDVDEGHGILRFELRDHAAGTVLVFTSTLALPSEFRSQTVAGWHYHLDALAQALDGHAVDLVELPNERWRVIHSGYQHLT